MRFKLAIIVCSIIIWVMLFWLNEKLFSHLVEQMGVSWIFLPSAARLLLVLLFDWPAVIGLILGSFLTGLQVYSHDHVLLVVGAILSGCTPYATLRLIESTTCVAENFSHLTAEKLLLYALAFAVVNSGCYQATYLLFGVDTQRTVCLAFFAMVTGDFLGSLIVLGAISVLLRAVQLVRRTDHPDPG